MSSRNIDVATTTLLLLWLATVW